MMESQTYIFAKKDLNIGLNVSIEYLETHCKTTQQYSIQWKKIGILTRFSTGSQSQSTQQWLARNLPGFISASDWPSGSLELDPLDYKL